MTCKSLLRIPLMGTPLGIPSLGILGLAALLALPTALSAQSPRSAPSASHLATFQAPDGETYFALGLRAHGVPAQTPAATDHLVMLDTSASQIGEHRTHALKTLDAFLANLPKTDRVALYGVDVTSVAMTDGFVKVGSAELTAGMDKLKLRVPLGATNLKRALDHCLTVAEPGNRTSVLYIGDGLSAARLLLSPEMKSLVDQFVKQQIPVHSYAVGPKVDTQLLGVLGLRTGGSVMYDQASRQREAKGITPEQVGAELATATHGVVYYPQTISSTVQTVTANVDQALLPAEPLPLRTDRTSIYLGKAKLARTFTVEAKLADSQLNWTVSTAQKNTGDSYLKSLWHQAIASQGMTVDLAGENMLANAQDAFNTELDRLAAFGERAVGFRQLEDAEQFAQTLNELDPGNARAKAMQNAVTTIKERQKKFLAVKQPEAPVPGGNPNGNANTQPGGSLLDQPGFGGNNGPFENAPPGASDEIDQILQRQAAITQQVQIETANRISEARQLMDALNPDAAIEVIKQALGRVNETEGVNPVARAELRKTLRGQLQAFQNKQQKIENDRRRQAEQLAALEAERRQVEAMMLEEERIEQLIDRVRALILDGQHGNDDAYEEAEVVAEAIVDLRPGNGPAAAALFTSEAAGQLNKAFRLRALRADRFLETLHQVELSHVPFPDEPPIRWPPAEVWKALTERRRKWASVDLHKSSPAEQRIQEALKETTEIDFIDTPLKDAMDFLGDLHNITIILDNAALAEDGIQPDEPINQVLSGISLRSALRIVLQPLSLRYIIQDEVMKITTETAAEDLARYGSTRVYPVGDLVIPIQQPLAGGLGQGFGGAGGFQGQGGLGQGGQFGQGGAGFGGGQQGGGGGGFFNIGPNAIPKANRPTKRNRNNLNEPVKKVQPKPLADPEAQQLLDDILGPQTSQLEFKGQAFAQVRDDLPRQKQPFRLDNESIEGLKKKVK